jgi:hypothetical protein
MIAFYLSMSRVPLIECTSGGCSRLAKAEN